MGLQKIYGIMYQFKAVVRAVGGSSRRTGNCLRRLVAVEPNSD